KSRTSYVLGTTGLGSPILRSLHKASRKIAIVQSPNMSIGVNLLFKLAEITAKALGENYDVELSEIHHRLKKDAPSGTAMKLVEILAEARKKNPAKDVVYGRKGETGARPRGKIGVFALRGGDVIGDHLLSFLGDGERIELIHRATSRDAFAQGAIRAAKFVAIKRTGLYHMQQVLGIA
ncbi:MAG TPA: 4-hydroxy-tetrahydrodipicolinate reductase, partial [bacterium]|nr:4-hydroxy-tetrahydrodipicolinate reductase [bacterium]